MKAFTHLALLALLFQALAMGQDNATSSASSTTDVNTTTVTSTPTSATSTATPTTTSPPATDTTAPLGTNTSTAANATAPPGRDTATAANATAPPGPDTATAANATAPPGPDTATAANATAPPGPDTATAANATAPPGPDTATAANATAPPGPDTATAANATAPPGPDTATAANATAPPGPDTATAANATAPPGPDTATAANATAPPGPDTATAANATAPPGPDTATAANATAPPGPDTATAANATAPPGPDTATAANATAPPGPDTATAANATAPPGPDTATAANATAPPGPDTATAANATAPPGPDTATATTESTTSNTATSTPNSAGPSTPCKEDSCKDGSLCVNLRNKYFCLCSEGYYYKSFKCNKGKIFPGTIKVKMSYTPEFENKTSEAYQNLYTQVTTFFRDTFNDSDYGQTVIDKVSPSASARSEMRAGNQGVDVAVVNIFTESTKETETSISDTIRKATNSASSNFSGYDPQDRCDYYGCKKPNDQNDCDSGLLCECKEGLARPNPQMPMCVASCSDTCNAEHKRQCLVRNESAACVCLPGYKEDDQRTCQACAFGYSGVNCEDSFQLILTIVGTIAGVLILGMLTALIVSMRLKNKGRDVEEETLIEKDSHNLRLKETGFSNLGAEGSIFPKVRVNLPRDSQSQNPYTSPYTLPDY
ncbi:hypothetical protein AB1E19_000274 [Capra hircus]